MPIDVRYSTDDTVALLGAVVAREPDRTVVVVRAGASEAEVEDILAERLTPEERLELAV